MSELVLVETISIIKHRYVVEVPDGKAEWALDTVTMEEAKEFSQTFINEDIIGHRVIAKEEMRKLWCEDPYTWHEAPDTVLQSYINQIPED